MWDYLSLPQRGRTTGYDCAADDRTPEQRAKFVAGLQEINLWYGHPRTTTLLLDTPVPSDASNQTPYEARGWCIFERRLSALVKDNDCFLSLSKQSGRTNYWLGIKKECQAERPPPMRPDDFAAMVRRGMEERSVCFTNGKDATEVRGTVRPPNPVAAL